MTPTLRRAHRYTWYVFAFLLPLAWLAAIRAIPGPVSQEPVRPPQPAALPVLLASRESGNVLVNLRADSAGARKQVEILLKSPQTNPSTLVYWSAGAGGPTQLIGALQTRGLYRFALDSLASGQFAGVLRLEDPLQKRLLRTVAFGPAAK